MKKLFVLLCYFWVAFTYAQTQQGNENPPAFTEAEALAQAGNCEEAITKYTEAIAAQQDNVKAWLGKANCEHKLGKNTEAINTLKSITAKKPEAMPAWQLLSKIYESEKNYTGSLTAHQGMIKGETVVAKKLKLYAGMVRLALLMNNITQAEGYLDQAKQLNANDKEVWYAEGEILRAKKDYMQAIGFYEKVIINLGKIAPADAAKYYYGLGDAYNKVGDVDNAVKSWQKARYGPYKKTVEAFLMRTNPEFYLKLGISYFQAGEYDEAFKQLQKATEIKNDFAQAYRYMGIIADKRDLTSEADLFFSRGIQFELDPDKKVEIEITYLNMLMDNELFDKALKVANNILLTKPGNPKVMLQKSQAEYNTGAFTAAIRTAQKALSDPTLSDPAKKAPYYFVIGMCNKILGDTNPALESFKNASFGSYKGAAQNEMELLQPEVY